MADVIAHRSEHSPLDAVKALDVSVVLEEQTACDNSNGEETRFTAASARHLQA